MHLPKLADFLKNQAKHDSKLAPWGIITTIRNSLKNQLKQS
jgi:hypothetical protein